MKTIASPQDNAPRRTKISRFQKIVVGALSVALLGLNPACSTTQIRKLDVSQLSQPVTEFISGVTLKDGTEVVFDAPGGVVTQTKVEAKVNGAPYAVAVSDVQRYWVERNEISALRTIGLAAVVVGGAAAIIAASNKPKPAPTTTKSCPFVYSWDGKQYVCDGEPYGGAITRGLERDDFSKLAHLREQDGQYRLLVTNEADETQYTNLMELWVVDHAPGARIVPDENGKLYSLTGIQPPRAARDRYGRDLLQWLSATDRKIWEPECAPGPDGSLRQEVTLVFAKPADAKHVNLVVNVATGLWGSSMIKDMTELRGRDAGAFLAAIDNDPAVAAAVHAWGGLQETFRLKVEVEESTGWAVRGAIPGGGPFHAEDRVVRLDVSRVPGDQLRVRVRPPVGYWALNSFGVAYDDGPVVAARTVGLKSATTNAGLDVMPELQSADASYYRMPEMTDRAELTFAAPPATPGQSRTIFLHSRGWYDLHLNASGPPDEKTLAMIATTPDGPVRFAANQYAAWKQRFAAD